MGSDANPRHWDAVYQDKDAEEMSWFQRDATVSLRLVEQVPGSVVDVGAGTSVLVDELLAAGRRDLTVLDVSTEALAATRRRLRDRADQVTFVVADVLDWRPARTFDCWHDRAVLHFLTRPDQQRGYVDVAARAVPAGGAVVLGTFGAAGPTECSGLPTVRFTPDELAALFGRRFAMEHAESETHLTPWGTEQDFTWVLLRRLPEPA